MCIERGEKALDPIERASLFDILDEFSCGARWDIGFVCERTDAFPSERGLGVSEKDFADRMNEELRSLSFGELILGIEVVDGGDEIVIEFDARGELGRWGINVDETAAYGVRPGIFGDWNAKVSAGLERIDEIIAVDFTEDFEKEAPLTEESARWHPPNGTGDGADDGAHGESA